MATLFDRFIIRRAAVGPMIGAPAGSEGEAGDRMDEDDEIRRMIEWSGMIGFDPEVAAEN